MHTQALLLLFGRETPLPLVGRIMEISGFEAIPILNRESKLQGIICERDLIRCAMIEDSVETSDLSTTGTDDDEWTWESIRDVHHISYGISRAQLPNRAGKFCRELRGGPGPLQMHKGA